MKKIFITSLLALAICSLIFWGSSLQKTEEKNSPENQQTKTVSIVSNSSASSTSRTESNKNLILLNLDELLALGDLEEARQRLMQQEHLMSTEDFNYMLHYILMQLALSDPVSAKELLAQYHSPEIKLILVRGILARLSTIDIHSAFEFLDSAATKDIPDDAFIECHNMVLDHYASQDPLGAMEHLIQLNDPNILFRQAPEVVRKVVLIDANKAFDWGVSLGDENTRHITLYNVFDAFNNEKGNVDSMMKKLIAHQTLWDGHGLAVALSRLTQWQPLQAANSLEQIEPDIQRQVTEAVVLTWHDSDPQAAADWLRSTDPNSEIFMTGVESLADAVSSEKPLEAMKWAAQINDSERKLQLMQRLVNNASAEQVEQIRNSLPSISIAHPERNELLAMLNKSLDTHYLTTQQP